MCFVPCFVLVSMANVIVSTKSCPLCDSKSLEAFFERMDKHLGKRAYLKCNNCRLIFLEPRQRFSPQDEKARYDEHRNDPQDPGYLQFLSKLADPLLERLKPGAQGLDYGCGPGPALGVLLKEGAHSLECYDPFYFNKTQLLEKKFDFVTCTEVIEHFYEPRQEFMKLDRLLKGPGSILALMTEILLDEGGFSGWWYPKDPTHVCFYQEATFQWISTQMGWILEFPCKNVVIYSK